MYLGSTANMFTILRKALTSWVALAIFAVVIVAFIVTGVGDPFGGGPPPTTVAEIGKDDIGEAELADQFDRQMQQVRAENPQVTIQQAIDAGTLDGVLERLIGARAIAKTAAALGLSASKRQVDADIAAIPAFRGPDGRFSEDTFRQVIAQQNVKEARLRQEMADDIMRRQMLDLVTRPSPTPRSLAEPYAALQLERRKLTIGAVPLQAFASATPPSDADIDAFYKRNIARFTIGERRRLSYAILDRAHVAGSVKVTQAALADYYKRHQDAYGAREARTLSQVVVQAKADADKIAARVAAGEAFAAVAADVAGYSAADLVLGEQTLDSFKSTVSADVAEAAFKAAEGTITAPVRSDFGWHIVRVEAIARQAARPLTAVTAEITPLVEAELVENRLADMVGEAEDRFADGASLKEVAQAVGLSVTDVPPVTREGVTLGSTDLKLEDRIRPVIEKAFAYDAAEDAAVEELAPGVYAMLDVDEVIPPTPIPLAGVKAQAAAGLAFERQAAAAKAAAQAIAAELKAGKPAGPLFAARKLPPAQTITLARIQLAQRQGPVPAALSFGFSLPRGEVRAVPDVQNGAWFVVRVDDIAPGKLAEAPGLVASVRSQMTQSASDELAQHFVGAMIAEQGIKRYPKALAALKARYLGGNDDNGQ
jgi:parvulin-like peptidyl-prolyl isomerase